MDSPLVRPGFVDDREVIALNLRTTVGEPMFYDQVQIDGEPAVQSKIAGGVNGYITTYAIALNVMMSVLEASSNLKTTVEIPPVAFFTERAV